MSTEWQGGNLLATAAGVLLKNSKFDMLHHRGSSTTGSLVDYTHRKQFRTGHPYYVFFFPTSRTIYGGGRIHTKGGQTGKRQTARDEVREVKKRSPYDTSPVRALRVYWVRLRPHLLLSRSPPSLPTCYVECGGRRGRGRGGGF